MLKELALEKVNLWIESINSKEKISNIRKTSITRCKFFVKEIVILNKINSFKVETLVSMRHWQIKESSSRKSTKEKTRRWLTQLTRLFRLLMKCFNKRRSRFQPKMNKLKVLESKWDSRDLLIRKRFANLESKHLVLDNLPLPRFIVLLQPKKLLQ